MGRGVFIFIATRCSLLCVLILLIALVTKVNALLELIELVFEHLCKVTRNLIDLLLQFPNFRVLFFDHLFFSVLKLLYFLL